MRAGNGVAVACLLATGALGVGSTGCGQAFSAGSEGGPDATADAASDGGAGSGDTGASSGDTGAGPGDSGKSDGPSAGDGGGVTDGGTAADGPSGGSDGGGPVCTRPDGGRPPDPGFVNCGGNECDLTTSVCCQLGKGTEASVSPPSCTSTNASCPALQVRVACDETADCQHGNVCCVDLVTGSATCAASCGAGLQLCRCDQECNGSPCTQCPGYERCTAQCG